MWYVVHCPNQDVYQVMHTLRRKMHPFTIRSVQVPSCDRKFKYHGEWHVEERPLFLERVFVECGDEKGFEKTKICKSGRCSRRVGNIEKTELYKRRRGSHM